MFVDWMLEYRYYLFWMIPTVSVVISQFYLSSTHLKRIRQLLLYLLLALFGVLWFQHELNMIAEGINIRLDLILIFPCAIGQLAALMSLQNTALLNSSRDAFENYRK